MEEIQLVPTDDLINELLRRYEHSVFAAFESLQDDKTLYVSRWKGNSATCAGLCSKTVESIWTDFRESGYSEKETSG